MDQDSTGKADVTGRQMRWWNPPCLVQIASHVHSHTQILGCRSSLGAEMPRPFISPSFLGHLCSKSPLLKSEPGGESVWLYFGLSAGFQSLLPFSLHSNFRGTETNELHELPPQTTAARHGSSKGLNSNWGSPEERIQRATPGMFAWRMMVEIAQWVYGMTQSCWRPPPWPHVELRRTGGWKMMGCFEEAEVGRKQFPDTASSFCNQTQWKGRKMFFLFSLLTAKHCWQLPAGPNNIIDLSQQRAKKTKELWSQELFHIGVIWPSTREPLGQLRTHYCLFRWGKNKNKEKTSQKWYLEVRCQRNPTALQWIISLSNFLHCHNSEFSSRCGFLSVSAYTYYFPFQLAMTWIKSAQPKTKSRNLLHWQFLISFHAFLRTTSHVFQPFILPLTSWGWRHSGCCTSSEKDRWKKEDLLQKQTNKWKIPPKQSLNRRAGKEHLTHLPQGRTHCSHGISPRAVSHLFFKAPAPITLFPANESGAEFFLLQGTSCPCV